jgi:hypothetical protein
MQRTQATRSRVPRAPVRQGPAAPLANAATVRRHVNRKFCRTSEYQPPGSTKVGLSPSNQPAKMVWELDYGLSDKKFKQLSERFPGIAFVQTGTDCHDHPIAHTSYRVVWRNILNKLKPGQKVADISGNPQHNEIFNRGQAGRVKPITIDTFCKVMSTKDSIRSKVRWGPQVENGNQRWEEVTVYDMYRNQQNRQRFAGYDVFLMNHSLYYYTMAEVNQLLQLNPNSVAVCTIHKLPGQNGEINCGEQRYEKDMVSGKVRQTNIETGEYYTHPDPAPWFVNFEYADTHGAMAWTINKGCDDTYVVTITSTDPRLVHETCWLDGKVIIRNGSEAVEAITLAGADPPPAYAVEEVVLQTSQLIPGCGLDKRKVVKITHPELYSQLKNFMINKPRNSRTLQDLTAKAHREAGNNTLLGGNQRVKITPEALTEHIAAAWVAGTGLEAEMIRYVSARYADVAAVNRNVSGKALNFSSSEGVLKQCARFALIGRAVTSSKDPIARVLEQLDELL